MRKNKSQQVSFSKFIVDLGQVNSSIGVQSNEIIGTVEVHGHWIGARPRTFFEEPFTLK